MRPPCLDEQLPPRLPTVSLDKALPSASTSPALLGVFIILIEILLHNNKKKLLKWHVSWQIYALFIIQSIRSTCNTNYQSGGVRLVILKGYTVSSELNSIDKRNFSTRISLQISSLIGWNKIEHQLSLLRPVFHHKMIFWPFQGLGLVVKV